MTEHEHEHDDGDHPLAKYEELFRTKAEGVEDAGRKLGLYLRDMGLAVAPDFDERKIQPVMVANFTVGDAAWSDRVQNPQQDSTEAEFRKLAHQAEREKFDEVKADLEKRLREGKGIFEEEADDGDQADESQ